MRKVVGDNYPLFFKTKEDFQSKLKSLSSYERFEWKLPNYDETIQRKCFKFYQRDYGQRKKTYSERCT